MKKKFLNLCRLILADRNTRNLFFFLVLNLIFAFVELTYGLWTNSLGLISDSFHMFFDCSALLLGLAASIVTKWRPNEKFTYGFGRAEVLAGLANGLFLLFIALFIMKEAIERTFEPPDVHHERLFIISVLGFIVNLIGIFVFQHGGQTHGGCSHSHSHSHPHHHNHSHSHTHKAKNTKLHVYDQTEYNYDNVHGYSHYSSPTILSDHQAVALDMNGYSGSAPVYATMNSENDQLNYGNHTHNHYHQNQSHDDHHSSYHNLVQSDCENLVDSPNKSRSKGRGQIMQSVLLHIIADTLGSVGVMISAVLMSQFGWMIADPLCSLFIAILIAISVYPLLRDSIYILMQRVPVEIEDKLQECFHKIQGLTGVVSIHEPHFWTLYSDTYVGCLKLEIKQGSNQTYISTNTRKLFEQLGVEKVHIQIDFV